MLNAIFFMRYNCCYGGQKYVFLWDTSTICGGCFCFWTLQYSGQNIESRSVKALGDWGENLSLWRWSKFLTTSDLSDEFRGGSFCSSAYETC
jgi:hypothetical protein